MKTRFVLLSSLLAALAATTATAGEIGNPQIKSIEALAFAPDGTLIIGDSRGAQVVTIKTAGKATQWKNAGTVELQSAIAGRLGTKADGIVLQRLAVDPVSKLAYVSVRRKAGKTDVLVTIDGSGKIREFPLDKVEHTRHALPGEKAPVQKITDVAQAGDRILVAAQANDTFANRIFSLGSGKADCLSAETYHVAHNKWETKAPIRTLIPYEEDGKPYLVGAFTCTPIVKYPLDAMADGAKVKGTSVIELGSGNTPLDMFTYKKGGKTWILVNTIRFFHARNPVGPSKYWTCKVDQSILAEKEKVNQQALRRVKNKASESLTDLAQVVETFHGVVMMDRLDEERAIVLREDGKGGLSLAVLPLP